MNKKNQLFEEMSSLDVKMENDQLHMKCSFFPFSFLSS